MPFYVGHDLGTGGLKSVVVDLEGRVHATHTRSYPLLHPRPGWAEQDPECWWEAVGEATRAVVRDAGRDPGEVRALAFAGQMLTLVPMDADGAPTRAALSWIDHRADAQAARLVRRFGGATVLRLLAGASPTAKDLVAKIAWIAEEEPEVHAATHAYGDATSFLVARATGRLGLDPTAAGATGLFDPARRRWSRPLAWASGFPLDRVPQVRSSVDVAGPLLPAAAAHLGLRAGLPVAIGLADIPAAALGAGAVEPGQAHLYLGTSAWVGVTAAAPRLAPRAGIATVPHAHPERCLVIGESETAGACRDFLTARLGLADDAALDALAAGAPPGARGLLFLPWLFGERSPFPDAHLRGGFVGLDLEHGASDMARAVLEGVALNVRCILDALDVAGEPCPTLRAIGGGAQSDLWMQIVADVTERRIERVAHPRVAGAVGAALLGAVACGDLASLDALRDRVAVERTFRPDARVATRYARHVRAMRSLARPMGRAARLLAEGDR